MTTDSAAFADTVREPTAPSAGPMAASRMTRIAYCLALMGLPLGMIFGASSWVGMALGGGLMTKLWPVGFFLIAAAVVYRVYGVARYPAALDARPPHIVGRVMRSLAWIVMAVGAIGMAGLFLGGPLAVLLFGRGGPDGIVIFAAGLVSVKMATVGWIGCVLFEASRLAGTRVPLREQRTRRQRVQDRFVLVVLVLLAVVPAVAFKVLDPDPCFELAACVAKVEGGVARRLAVPLGVPVILETNIEGIEYRQTHGKREWVRTELPAFSLLRAGHPVAATSEGLIRVSVQATPAKKGIAVVLTVQDKGEETARFTTHYASNARIDSASNSTKKLVIMVPRDVVASGEQAPGEGTLDALFQQMRAAIGSPREVAEEVTRVKVTAERLGASEPGKDTWESDPHLSQTCAGIVKREEHGKSEYDPKWATPMSELVFVQQPERVTLLLRSEDRATCTGSGVWLAQSRRWREGLLELRKYDMQGSLQHSLLVALPPTRSPEDYAVFVPRELLEHDGNVEFAFHVRNETMGRLERYRVKL